MADGECLTEGEGGACFVQQSGAEDMIPCRRRIVIVVVRKNTVAVCTRGGVYIGRVFMIRLRQKATIDRILVAELLIDAGNIVVVELRNRIVR